MGRRYRSSRDGRLVISAVAAGIGLAVLSGHHGHLSAAAAADTSEHGTLGCAGLEALWESAGVPTVVLGPAGGGLHTDVEWLDLRQLEAFTDGLARVIAAG